MEKNEIKISWGRLSKILLALQILIFFVFGLYLVKNIRFDIGPDEPYHLNVAKAYSKTSLIPENSPETYEWGDITSVNYLAHWINGRLINVNIFQFDELSLLRFVGLIFSVGTLLVTYLISKEVIKEEKYQVIPVILLANTLMFQFLSGVLNYDNLTNLLATVSIFFVVKIIKNPSEIKYYSLWVVFSCLGVLSKYTVFPLVLIEFLVVLYIVIKSRPKFDFRSSKLWMFVFLALLFVAPVLLLYGKNVIYYNSILPNCELVLDVESCLNNGIFERDYGQAAGIAVLSKEGMGKVFSLRWNPILYFFIWVYQMNMRIYGIMAHRDMFIPYEIHLVYLVFPVSLAIQYLKNRMKREKIDRCLMALLLFYTYILAFVQNYPTYLNRDGIIYALQGRYIFPVIPIYYILLVKYLSMIQNKTVRKNFFIFLLVVFLLGCIPLFLFSVTPEWLV